MIVFLWIQICERYSMSFHFTVFFTAEYSYFKRCMRGADAFALTSVPNIKVYTCSTDRCNWWVKLLHKKWNVTMISEDIKSLLNIVSFSLDCLAFNCNKKDWKDNKSTIVCVCVCVTFNEMSSVRTQTFPLPTTILWTLFGKRLTLDSLSDVKWMNDENDVSQKISEYYSNVTRYQDPCYDPI